VVESTAFCTFPSLPGGGVHIAWTLAANGIPVPGTLPFWYGAFFTTGAVASFSLPSRLLAAALYVRPGKTTHRPTVVPLRLACAVLTFLDVAYLCYAIIHLWAWGEGLDVGNLSSISGDVCRMARRHWLVTFTALWLAVNWTAPGTFWTTRRDAWTMEGNLAGCLTSHHRRDGANQLLSNRWHPIQQVYCVAHVAACSLSPILISQCRDSYTICS